MKRILVPTDFSVSARNALVYAHLLFNDEEIQWTLCHAYQPNPLQMVGRSPSRLSHVYKSLKSKTEFKLVDQVQKLRDASNNPKHTYTTTAIAGTLVDAIKSMDINRYDFLIMGSKGATGLKELLWGSNTHMVVKLNLPLPLLIIPEMAVFITLQSIAFATNFDQPYSEKELLPLIELYRRWDTSLRMIQVYHDTALSANQEANLKILQSIFKNIPQQYHVIPNFSDIESGILAFTEELNIDLLAVVNSKHGFLEKLVREAVVKKLSYHTPIPLLILPALD